MNKTRAYWDKSIATVMSEFDFDRVHHVMVLMGWKWCPMGVEPHIPTALELRATAARLMRDAVDDRQENPLGEYQISTGGFSVRMSEKDISLSFEIASISASDYDPASEA